jgi:TetR/AcrR family transcriptional regulator, repressor for uid operon
LSDRSLIDLSLRLVYKKVNARSIYGFFMRKADPELHRRRREGILEAAIACFIRKGFHQSSMQDLAGEAGVSMGLLYRYFKNKEAIIEAAADRERAFALGVIAAVPDGGDATTHWTKAVATLVAAATQADAMRLVNEIVAEAGRTPRLLAMLQAYDAEMEAAICARLSGHDEPALAAQAILMLIDGLSARVLVAPDISTAQVGQIAGKTLSAFLPNGALTQR